MRGFRHWLPRSNGYTSDLRACNDIASDESYIHLMQAAGRSLLMVGNSFTPGVRACISSAFCRATAVREGLHRHVARLVQPAAVSEPRVLHDQGPRESGAGINRPRRSRNLAIA